MTYRVEKLQKILMWSYDRGTWQYDIIVILILAFIFFTPRSFINTQRIDRRIMAYSHSTLGSPLGGNEKGWISLDESGRPDSPSSPNGPSPSKDPKSQ